VRRLRDRKRRDTKPFALMARDLDMIRRYCTLGPAEAHALTGPEAPIVLLAADGPERLPAAIAPGLATLGFMLPTTPLHLLIACGLDRPLVMTSGNLADEPQVTRDGELGRRLGEIVGHALVHDRPIAHRVDDSVVRVVLGAPRVLRRARGFAPTPIPLPHGFERAPEVLALGGDLKATFCMIARGEAVMSQHQGELANPGVQGDYRASLALYTALLSHAPTLLATDLHPELQSGQLAQELAAAPRAAAAAPPVPLHVVPVQHHHAHVAACLVDNAHPLDGSRVLGIVLDGLGLGDDGTLWGGEVLLADYLRAERVAALRPVAMLGGDRAALEPWRNLYAHLVAAVGWPALEAQYGALVPVRRLADRPRAVLDAMLARGLNAPLASSCGRLFDAVAAALGLAFERQAYEGEAAMRLEAVADPRALEEPDDLAYAFAAEPAPDGPLFLDARPLWEAILRDLATGVPAGVISARFHGGLARTFAELAHSLHRRYPFEAVALSGGCFQNRVLLEQCARRLRALGLRVLLHGRIPPNDGGLSIGQAAVAAARALRSGAS
jgi:hydrogenase maturation protein HypF